MSLEDFTTEALCIAVARDPRPLTRALQKVDPPWAAVRSGAPSIDLAAVVDATTDTQRYLYHEGLKGGRLDLLVRLKDATGAVETLWIEVKIDAGLTYNDDEHQLVIYLEHRDLEPSKPVLLTLARTKPLAEGVAGITWADLIDGVEQTPDADPWWADLVAFLRAKGAAAAPPGGEDLAIEVMPVFAAVDRAVQAVWPRPQVLLAWGGRLERKVRDTFKQHGYIWLKGGPLRHGLVKGDNGWEWRVALATGSDDNHVHVGIDELITAARDGGLPDTWERLGDREAVLQKRRPYDQKAPNGPAADWLADGLRELAAANLLEPYFKALQAKLDAARAARDARARTLNQ